MTPNQLLILLYTHVGHENPDTVWAENALQLNRDGGYLDEVYDLTSKGESIVEAVIRMIKLPDTPFPAYPIPFNPGETFKSHGPADGLTKFEYFKGQALVGLLANPQYDRRNIREDVEHLARMLL